MEGVQNAAVLYGQYAEKYLHAEKFLPVRTGNFNRFEEEAWSGSYDARRLWSVVFWHTVYILLLPFIMVRGFIKDSNQTAININLNDQVKEIGSGALTAARRDFGVICGGNKVDGREMEGNRERKFDEHNRF